MKHYKFLPGLLFAIFIITLSSCGKNDIDVKYRQYMREFVQGISAYSKEIEPDFIVIPQNGQELVTVDGEETGPPEIDYLGAIDGVGREDLFYGYKNDNDATREKETDYMISYLDICEDNGVEVLTTDYCWDHSKMDNSYQKNAQKGYISFAAPKRGLHVIPDYPLTVFNENNSDINNLSDAKNFLYLIDPGSFSSKTEFIGAVNNTNYDLVIMDLFFEEGDPFVKEEIDLLLYKKNGGKRLIICYMSIGEAEDYRYYWENSWKVGSPEWIEKENRNWKGNYKVKYWKKGWQDIIYGNESSYLKRIIDAGFDGVYLDIIDAFEYFE